jgi:hypothetical protein
MHIELQKIVPLLVGCALLGNGCMSIRVDSYHDRAADFTGLTTYSWADAPVDSAVIERDRTFAAKRVRAAVDQQLAAKGYNLIGSGTPTFRLRKHLALFEKLDITTVNTRYAYSPSASVTNTQPGGWVWATAPVAAADMRYYEEGAVILEVVDDAGALLWRGAARGEATLDASDRYRDKKINKAVRKILAHFPPK